MANKTQWERCVEEASKEYLRKPLGNLYDHSVIHQHAADLYAMRFIEQTTGDGWLQVSNGIWMNGIDHKIPMTERKTTQQLLEQFNNQE